MMLYFWNEFLMSLECYLYESSARNRRNFHSLGCESHFSLGFSAFRRPGSGCRRRLCELSVLWGRTTVASTFKQKRNKKFSQKHQQKNSSQNKNKSEKVRTRREIRDSAACLSAESFPLTPPDGLVWLVKCYPSRGTPDLYLFLFFRRQNESKFDCGEAQDWGLGPADLNFS
jgi:hypothetical protein